MKKEWLVKTLALGIIVLFIGVSFQPVFAIESSEKVTINDEKIIKCDILPIFILRVYCFGPIYNLTIDNETGHEFESNNLRKLRIFFVNFHDWAINYEHSPYIHIGFGPGMKFRGILKPTFICGFFY